MSSEDDFIFSLNYFPTLTFLYLNLHLGFEYALKFAARLNKLNMVNLININYRHNDSHFNKGFM